MKERRLGDIFHLIFLVLPFFLAAAAGEIKAVAFFKDYVNGTITFTQGSAGTLVQVSISGLPKNGTYKYHIHEYPVDSYASCSSTGPHFNPKEVPASSKCRVDDPTNCEVGDLSGKHGALNSIESATTVVAQYTDPQIALEGKDSIIGRSIVIHKPNGDRFKCATIVEMGTFGAVHYELVAVFPEDSKIQGKVTFHQKNEEGVLIEYDLRGFNNFNGPFSLSVNNHPISIPGNCYSGGPHFDPQNVTESCKKGELSSCKKGNISGKFGTISYDVKGTARGFFYDPSFEIFAKYKIDGLSVVIIDEAVRIGCANIKSPHASAIFTGERGLAGTIALARGDGGTSTRFDISLFGLPAGEEYEILVSEKAAMAEGLCENLGIFDPFGTGLSAAYTCTTNTISNCTLGDISGKFGTISHSASGDFPITQSFTDKSISITSIVDRAILVKKKGGPVISCAPIALEGEKVYTGVASFDDKGVNGSVTFTQPQAGPTSIWVHLHGLSPNQEYTYVVANFPVNSLGECSSIGDLFDPFSLKNANYSCVPDNPLSCAFGDLSGKFGKLIPYGDIYLDETHLDLQIMLHGADSLLGRSVLISDENGPFVCGTIAPKIHRNSNHFEGVAIFQGDSFSGHISFLQHDLDEDVSILVELSFLPSFHYLSSPLSLAIYSDPVDSWSECPKNGEILDPTRTPPQEYSCSPKEFDYCKLGDLTGKFGQYLIDSQKNLRRFEIDPSLDLNGRNSILGRSVVILADEVNIVGCANIGGSSLLAPFYRDKDIHGAVFFQSLQGYGVQVRVEMDKFTEKGQFSYFIATKGTAESGKKCASALDVYDPYDQKSNSEYICGLANLDLCKVGDLSAKHGKLEKEASRDIAYATFNDYTISLMDINGKSVFLTNEKGKVVACANIGFHLPEEKTLFSETPGFGALMVIVLLVCSCLVIVGTLIWRKKERKRRKVAYGRQVPIELDALDEEEEELVAANE